MKLTVKQQEGVDKFAEFLVDDSTNEFRLVGFSGCGKSFLTIYLIELIEKKRQLKIAMGGSFNYEVQLTATTNKAAKALKDAIGESHPLYESVSTIQSYLSLVLQNNYTNGKQNLVKSKQYKVKHNVICFIDESSYIDDHLLKIIRESFIDSKIVFIGDSDQLLPVYHDIAPAFIEPASIFLDETVRQAKGSSITELGHAFRRVLHGEAFPKIEDYLDHDVVLIDGLDFQSLTDTMFTSDTYRNDPNHCKIIGWSNTKVQEYNAYVRKLWTSTTPYVTGEYVVANSVVISGNQTLASNESVKRILAASPPYDMYGVTCQSLGFDFGTVIVPLDFDKAKKLIKSAADAKDWQLYFQLKEEFCDFRPNHALTTHKAQGSTYENVFLDLTDIGRNTRNTEIARLMYVAVTRASKKLYLYGQLPKRLYL